jgi:uncharacterized protein (TIGR02596 family)
VILIALYRLLHLLCIAGTSRRTGLYRRSTVFRSVASTYRIRIMKQSPRSGFTLIELLAVVALIAVVITFAVPAVSQIMKGSQMSQGSQMLNDTLLLARQYAITRNHPIEVRFYRYGDPDTPGEKAEDPESGKWRAIQMFDVLENGAVLPAAEMVKLPNGVIMHPADYSTLLREEIRPHIEAANDHTAPEIPLEINDKKVGRNYWISSFRYLPDGSTDLPPAATIGGGGTGNAPSDDRWYVTLMGLTEERKNIAETNFFTIQVDSINGTLKSFRPTAR